MEILKKNHKDVVEISGVMPNPTLAKLYEGVEIARNHNADLLLAADLFATILRQLQCQFTVRRTHGKNTLSVLKNQIVKSFQLAVF